jgi:hypothetical protein
VAFIMAADIVNFRATAGGRVESSGSLDFLGFSLNRPGEGRAFGDGRGQTTRRAGFLP